MSYKSFVRYDENGGLTLDEISARELAMNNCTMPHVNRVIFRLNDTKKDYPVLTTIVFFDDSTKVVVQNSYLDPVSVKDRTLSDGTTIKIPAIASREAAVNYAIVKRIFSSFDNDGKIIKSGLSSFYDDVFSVSSIENLDEAEAKISKAKAKAAAKAQAAKKLEPKKACSKTKVSDLITSILSNLDHTTLEQVANIISAASKKSKPNEDDPGLNEDYDEEYDA